MPKKHHASLRKHDSRSHVIYLKGLSSREHASLHVFLRLLFKPHYSDESASACLFPIVSLGTFDLVRKRIGWQQQKCSLQGLILNVSPRHHSEVTLKKDGGFPRGASGV